MSAIGLAFRLAVTPDTFLTSIGRPLSSYNIPNVINDLAEDVTAALHARGGFAQAITFTPALIGGLTPLALVYLLRDYGLLGFATDPETLADQQRSQTGAAPTVQ